MKRILFAVLMALVLAYPVSTMGARVSTPVEDDWTSAIRADFCERKPNHKLCQTPTPSPTPSPSPSSTPSAPPTATPTATTAPTASPTPTPAPTASPTPSPTTTPPPTPPTSCPSTLAAGITATPTGGTLNVTGCSFSGDTTVGKAITIVGGKVTNGRVLIRTSDVTLVSLEVQGGGAGLQQGNIDVDNASRVTIQDVYVHDSMGSCVSMSNVTDGTIEDSRFVRCQQQGFHATSVTRWTFQRNIVEANNSATAPGPRVDSGWEAGGGKATVVRTAWFLDNESFGNGGPGLWCDIDCRDVTYRGNRVHDNDGQGIFWEISDGALIEDNVIWENGWASPAWAYGAGIMVSSSRNVMVRGNVVVDNARGISVISQNRSGHPVTAPGDTSGLRVEDNDVVMRSGAGFAGFYQDWGGNLFTAPSNGGAGNRYWSSVSEPSSSGIGRFEWAGHRNTLAAYNLTPGEEGGVYMTTAQKDALLTAHGIPGAPAPSTAFVGFGSNATGGAGHPVVWVTNLNDGGPGSLRAATYNVGNRIIRFSVSGTINIGANGALYLTEPNVTIDGCSAPGNGITLTGYPIFIRDTNNIIVQCLTHRGASGLPDQEGDGITVGTRAYDVVLDRLSISGWTDEAIGIWDGNHDITISNVLIGPGGDPAHNFAILVGKDSHRVTVTRNVIIDTQYRNPACGWDDTGQGRLAPSIVCDVVNNLVWDYTGYGTTSYWGGKSNVVGNYYYSSTHPSSTNRAVNTENGGQAYSSGNYSKDGSTVTGNVGSPFAVDTYARVTARDVHANAAALLGEVGDRTGGLDAFDAALLADIAP